MSKPLPNDYLDRVLRGLWQRAPGSLLRLAFDAPELVVEALEDPAPVLVRRAADGAARVRDRRGPFMAHLEFETDGREEVLWRAALYGLLLTQRSRLPVRSAVVLLEPAGALKAGYEMWHGEDLLCHYRVELVRLYEVPASRLAAQVDLAALAPLGAGAELSDLERAASTIRAEAPRAERGDLLAALYIVGGRRFALPDVLRVFSREELMESVTYRHLVEESMREGLLRGQQEGLLRGQQEGRQILLTVLLRHLGRRFPSEVDRLRPLLDSASLEELDALSDDVLTATSVVELDRRLSVRLSGD